MLSVYSGGASASARSGVSRPYERASLVIPQTKCKFFARRGVHATRLKAPASHEPPAPRWARNLRRSAR